MSRINIKPLSVNDCYQGRRFKTPAYKAYEKTLMVLLKPVEIPVGRLKLALTIGFSNKASDIDNPVKNFTDILQKKYDFNDNRIYCLTVEKRIVKKGDEFIDFEITGYGGE